MSENADNTPTVKQTIQMDGLIKDSKGSSKYEDTIKPPIGESVTWFNDYELSVMEDAVETGDVFAKYLSDAYNGRFEDDWGRRKITEALVILKLKKQKIEA